MKVVFYLYINQREKLPKNIDTHEVEMNVNFLFKKREYCAMNDKIIDNETETKVKKLRSV